LYYTAWYPDPIESVDKKLKTIKWAQTNTFQAFRTAFVPALFVGTAAGIYTVGECMGETLNGDKDDPMNALYGGAMAGAFLGAKSRRPVIAAATSLLLGLGMFTVASGGPVYGDREAQTRKMYSELPPQHVESDELKALKEKYPKFQHI